MPTYDYRCNACGHTFEQFQSMKDKALTKCPECKKSALERLIGLGGGIIFKGSGFYQTDYRSDSYKKAADADAKPAAANGHVHSGSCGCGAKPAGECPSSAAKADKPAKKSNKSGAA
ncbi:MAG: zinc ribbon domain-containing protein [Phycisphaerales bacterium]|nr:zinc ribbon domain-containing protein [Phycisphaerales bacterium]